MSSKVKETHSNNKVTINTYKVAKTLKGIGLSNNTTCVDLKNSEFGIVDNNNAQKSGSEFEVWFEYQIEGGNYKSCKGNKAPVDVSEGRIQRYVSFGSTLNNNTCQKRSHSSYSASDCSRYKSNPC